MVNKASRFTQHQEIRPRLDLKQRLQIAAWRFVHSSQDKINNIYAQARVKQDASDAVWTAKLTVGEGDKWGEDLTNLDGLAAILKKAVQMH